MLTGFLKDYYEVCLFGVDFKCVIQQQSHVGAWYCDNAFIFESTITMSVSARIGDYSFLL